MPIDIPKPKLGEPCPGCGLCCKMEPCGLAQEIMGHTTKGPCRALEEEDGKYICGLVKRPAFYMFGEENVPESETGWLSVLYANALGIGRGCDAITEDEQ